MKRLLRENWNRAVAVILVLTMVLGLWPMASEVRAETHYSGRLHLEGAQTVSGANHMYLRGTDGALSDLRGDWTPHLTPADDESGVYVNGERLTGGYELIKYNGDVNNVYNWYYLTGFDFSSAGTGTVKVKGSFIISTTKEVVELKEVTFTYNNGTWTESQELDETYEITNCGGGATDIYLYGTSSMPVKNWQTSLTACENGEITFYDSETNETTELNVDIRRPDNGFYYLVLADKNNGLSATKGDIVSIQGQFYMGDYYVDFVPAKFKFNGSGWSKATDYRQLTFRAINSATGYNDGYNGWFFYLDPSQELPGTGDVTHFTGLKMSVGDGEPFDVRVDKSSHHGTAFLAVSGADVPKNFTENMKIVLHAGKADSDDGSDGIELTSDFIIYANQYGMSTEGFITSISYNALTFTGINSATGYNDDYNGWFFYLNPSQELPGTEDVTHFTGLKLSVGNGEAFDVRVDKSSNQGAAFLAVPGTCVPKNLTENTKIVLHAGKADSDDGSDGIELTGDFIIYANQYGMSTEGFITPPSYKSLTFTGINSATEYSDGNGWLFYLNPSVSLPGTADSTNFKGLKISVDGKETDITVIKASHEGTAFMVVSPELLPEDITQNTKIVIKTGKADSDDGSDGIELTSDFTIYANQYGMSTEGFLQGATVIQTNARLTLDNNTAFGGNENGLYMNTDDKFPTDTTWATKIKAYSYDTAGGVFLNGEKIDAPLIRYADGKLYVGLADAGVFAKDKDKVTIKGTFSLGEEALSYAEVSYYYNGKAWGEQYEAPKPESYKKFSVNEVNEVSGWNSSAERWDIYLNVNTLLPGEGDKISFNSLAVEINGKTIETTMYHASYGDTLFFVIEGKDLPENVKDGTRIVLKAGKALAGDRTTGIELTQDFALYIWKGTTMGIQPTTNTEWQDVTPVGLLRTATFNKDMNAWLVHMKLQETLATESGTRYLELPVKVNGKEYQVKAQQDGVYLMLMIPDSVLPASAKNATITIPKGAKAVAKAGYKGIQFKEELVFYLFNGVLSEHKFEEIEEIEAKITGLQTIWVKDGIYHLYLRLNKEFPGTPWYERYSDFKYYYNGKEIGTDAVKPDSSNLSLIHISEPTRLA